MLGMNNFRNCLRFYKVNSLVVRMNGLSGGVETERLQTGRV